MIQNVFPYQFMVNLVLQAKRMPYSTDLKDLLRRVDIEDFARLEVSLANELQNASLQNQESAEYFLFISKQTLSYYLHRRDNHRLRQTIKVIRRRLATIASIPAVSINDDAWQQYLWFYETGISRLLRQKPIEPFEEQIGDGNWAVFDKDMIRDICTVVGYIYLNETEAEQAEKSLTWYKKAIQESEFEQSLGCYVAMAHHYLNKRLPLSINKVKAIITMLQPGKKGFSSYKVQQLFNSGILELEAKLLLVIQNTQVGILPSLLDFERRYQEKKLDGGLPKLVDISIEATLAQVNKNLYATTDRADERANFANVALRSIDAAINQTGWLKDRVNLMVFKTARLRIAVATGAPVAEKKAKEIVQYYMKWNDPVLYIEAIRCYLEVLKINGQDIKCYEILMNLFKIGQKKIALGGFYLITIGMQIANDLFYTESEKPGVSWIIQILEPWFAKVKSTIDLLNMDIDSGAVGIALIKRFWTEFIRFEPLSHFHIKVYFQYQLYRLKMIQIGARFHHDKLTGELVVQMIQSLEDVNNPLNIITAQWEDFKEVPNLIRNKTLNKCISISKGDLTLAAEHLDFPYRNLRKLITLKEVNRLGFFLNMQQTNNRQLEKGIRLMLYDLYKNGTIFEVVFDMPKFLVETASDGFFSQTLEYSMKIKGTTAKKYIKRMIEIGLIRQDEGIGRRHFYRLIEKNVMKRLAQKLSSLETGKD